jgi:LmbE family N-acetylglucosaminyl deacetylase
MNATDYVDIAGVIERKIDALRCHKSQVGDDVGEGIRQWATETGKTAQLEYAEGFRVMRLVGEQHNLDPVPDIPTA